VLSGAGGAGEKRKVESGKGWGKAESGKLKAERAGEKRKAESGKRKGLGKSGKRKVESGKRKGLGKSGKWKAEKQRGKTFVSVFSFRLSQFPLFPVRRIIVVMIAMSSEDSCSSGSVREAGIWHSSRSNSSQSMLSSASWRAPPSFDTNSLSDLERDASRT